MENKARCNIFLMRVPKGDKREMERDNIWRDSDREL